MAGSEGNPEDALSYLAGLSTEDRIQAVLEDPSLLDLVPVLVAARDTARQIAKDLREAFPDSSWQSSQAAADAADAFDEAQGEWNP